MAACGRSPAELIDPEAKIVEKIEFGIKTPYGLVEQKSSIRPKLGLKV